MDVRCVCKLTIDAPNLIIQIQERECILQVRQQFDSSRCYFKVFPLLFYYHFAINEPSKIDFSILEVEIGFVYNFDLLKFRLCMQGVCFG